MKIQLLENIFNIKQVKLLLIIDRFKMIRSFGEDILSGKIKISEAEEKNSSPLNDFVKNLMMKLDQNQNQIKRKKEIVTKL